MAQLHRRLFRTRHPLALVLALLTAAGGLCLLGNLPRWSPQGDVPTAGLTPRTAGDPAAPSMLLPADRSTHARLSEAYGKLPLQFEVNQGQTDPEVQFISRGGNHTLFLTPTEAVLALRKPSAESAGNRLGQQSNKTKAQKTSAQQAVVRIRPVDANPQPEVEGTDELPGTSNYLLGDDPANWHTALPTYAKVKYRGVYPGVDLVYYGNRQGIEYDFRLAPGADPDLIKLEFTGLVRMEMDVRGDLVLHTAAGEVRQHRPIAYQEVDGSKREVDCSYTVKNGREVTFNIGEYDAGRELVIDPVIAYSTYLGGSGFDRGYGIAVDSAGNAYVAGETGSTNFPTTQNAFQPAAVGGEEAFLVKLVGDSSLRNLYWQNQAGGQIGVWLMNRLALVQTLFFNPSQVADTTWKIVGAQ